MAAPASDLSAKLRNPIGLCATCRHVRVVRSARGSRFYLCQLSEVDDRFVKYPPLPVVKCVGYSQPPGSSELPGGSSSVS